MLRAGLALLPGDLLLFESDRAAWQGCLDVYVGQLCGVRLTRDGDVRYEMAVLKRGDNGPTCELPGAYAIGGSRDPS